MQREEDFNSTVPRMYPSDIQRHNSGSSYASMYNPPNHTNNASAPPFASTYSSDYSLHQAPSFQYLQNPESFQNYPPMDHSCSSKANSQKFHSPSQQQASEFALQYPLPPHQQSYLSPYEQYHSVSNFTHSNSLSESYASPISSNPNSSSYDHIGSSIGGTSQSSYQDVLNYEGVGGYASKGSGNYGDYERRLTESISDLNISRSDTTQKLLSGYDPKASLRDDDDEHGSGVYAYRGGKSELYGSRGTAPKSPSSVLFDDYGRSMNAPTPHLSKIARAVPKADTQPESSNGVQKFRVKLLADNGGGATDVLCQVYLDGIRMLDPSSNRTLRIYPLETIIRFQVIDSSTLAIWVKAHVDIEPRRIRLQSNSYTTSTLLDIVTAATVQFKEISGHGRPENPKADEHPAEKKKGFSDWVNFIKPSNEEKDHWVPDEAVKKCGACQTDFGSFLRRHHCRNCGDVFCDKCTQGRTALTAEDNAQTVRVCDRCMAEVTQRLSSVKGAPGKSAVRRSHEDFAKKLQEEMERNRKLSVGAGLNETAQKMVREVACPTCTVHLQVQAPEFGSETIECGVCQQPFLVGAH